jgi:hypothetical protein
VRVSVRTYELEIECEGVRGRVKLNLSKGK